MDKVLHPLAPLDVTASTPLLQSVSASEASRYPQTRINRDVALVEGMQLHTKRLKTVALEKGEVSNPCSPKCLGSLLSRIWRKNIRAHAAQRNMWTTAASTTAHAAQVQ